MLTGSGVGAMSIEVAKEAQTADAAKEDASMYNPANLKTETLPDGWAMTFENKGAMGTNYWVDVRRTIDGKSYKCSTTGSDAKQAAAVLAACKSLRKDGQSRPRRAPGPTSSRARPRAIPRSCRHRGGMPPDREKNRAPVRRYG